MADFLPVYAANAAGPFLVVQALLGRGLLGHPPEGADGGAAGGGGGGAAGKRTSLVANVSSIMGSNADPTVSGVTPGAFSYR